MLVLEKNNVWLRKNCKLVYCGWIQGT